MRFGRLLRAMGALAVVLFAAVPGIAAPSGVTAAPLPRGGGAIAASLGYVERDVEDGTLDEARSRRLLFKGAVGVGGGFDLYAFLGLADLQYRDADFEGNLGEDVGLGVRFGGLVLGDETTHLVFDLQAEYFASDDGDRTSRHQGYHMAVYAVGEYGASGRVGFLYPYGGIRLSYADYDNEHFDDFKSDDAFGILAGADYFVSPNVFFGGEIHLFDESSLYLSAGYRF
jgi:opacity protein-like surface antigen